MTGRGRPVRVLLIDDDEEEFVLAESLLQAAAPGEYALEWVATYAAGQRALEAADIEAALIDYRLGARSGLEFIGDLSVTHADVPMILLTGQGDRAVEAAALAAGATDYLEKRCVTGPMLDRSLRYALGRRRAATALQGSEARFRAIVENSTEGLALLDGQRRILFQSPAVTGILGYTREEMQGRPFDAFLRREDVEPNVTTFQEAVQHPGRVLAVELIARHKDGTWRVLECSMVSRLHQLAVGAVVCNYRDVSRRRSAENATRAAARQFRAVFEGALDGMVIAGDQRQYIAANRAALELLGTSEAVLVKDGVPSFAAAAVGQAPAIGATVNGKGGNGCQVRRSDGMLLEVECSGTANILPGQHLTILHDVTDRRAAERTVAQAQARFAAIFVNNPTAMFIYDAVDGRITDANLQFERLTEHPHDGTLGRSTDDLALWADGDTAAVLLLGADLVKGREARLICRSGSPRDVLVSVERLDAGLPGDQLRVALIADVTEQRVLETQLRESQKMEAVGQLAGGIAHDFNNILTVIIGYADVLLSRPELGEEAVREAREITKAGRAAADLTQQLLAFSRRSSVERGVIDANDVVAATHSMLARLIGDDIEMVVTLAPDLKGVVADAGLIQQCVMNLAVNARDAMPSGGRLSIETANVVLDEAFVAGHAGSSVGAHVRIAVSDTGGGMDDAVKAQAFEPFFTTKPTGKGTGLGLSTVYGALKQSHGFIDVESAPSHGSTFRMYLPAAATAAAKALDGQPIACPRASEAILLVEDETGVRELVQQVLRDQGYAVTAAAGSKEALEILGSSGGAIDLLLIDVNMPVMGGRELARLCQDRYPDARVLYMSGNPDALSTGGIMEPGLALIRKPFAGAALLERIRAVLDAPTAPGV
jgi:PAS domain S-box-containing protein